MEVLPDRLSWLTWTGLNWTILYALGAPEEILQVCVRNDEFCIKTDEFGIENDAPPAVAERMGGDEHPIQKEEFFIKNDEFCVKMTDYGAGPSEAVH